MELLIINFDYAQGVFTMPNLDVEQAKTPLKVSETITQIRRPAKSRRRQPYIPTGQKVGAPPFPEDVKRSKTVLVQAPPEHMKKCASYGESKGIPSVEVFRRGMLHCVGEGKLTPEDAAAIKTPANNSFKAVRKVLAFTIGEAESVRAFLDLHQIPIAGFARFASEKYMAENP